MRLHSQVFFPFEEGIPFSPLRKKIINTFVVAMPTRGLSLCSQLWAFLVIITHSSRTRRNYPQSICTALPIPERYWGMGSREAWDNYLHILSHKTAHSFERSYVFNGERGRASLRAFTWHLLQRYVLVTLLFLFISPPAASLLASHSKLHSIFVFFLDMWPTWAGMGMSFSLWETCWEPTICHAIFWII